MVKDSLYIFVSHEGFYVMIFAAIVVGHAEKDGLLLEFCGEDLF